MNHMKRMTLKKLFSQVLYTYNALCIQMDMVRHDPSELDELGRLISQYDAEFKRQEKEWKEYNKKRYEKK